MVIWVKTTIDIADGLLTEAKQRASAEGTTLRAYVERGLRTVLSDAETTAADAYRPVTFQLEPLPGVDPYDWDAIYDSIYDKP
jgi:Arc/MetJ family transcription regulator